MKTTTKDEEKVIAGGLEAIAECFGCLIGESGIVFLWKSHVLQSLAYLPRL